MQYEIPVLDGIDAPQLIDLASRRGADLWPEFLERLEKGTLALAEQDERLVTYAPMLEKEDGHIDWTAPAEFIINHIRALQGWPGTFTDHVGLDGHVKNTLRVGHGEKALVAEGKVFPGTVIEVTSQGPVVACRKGAVRLTRLQLAGHKMLEARDFLNGYPMQVGEKLM
jgi:methionyl-tRNA formyltransferase